MLQLISGGVQCPSLLKNRSKIDQREISSASAPILYNLFKINFITSIWSTLIRIRIPKADPDPGEKIMTIHADPDKHKCSSYLYN